MREPTGAAPRRTYTQRPTASGRTNAAPRRASGTTNAGPRRVTNVRGTSGGLSASSRARNAGGPIIDIPATAAYFRDNPMEALKLGAQMAWEATPGGVAQSLAEAGKNKDAAGAALIAAGALPIPGGGAAKAAAAAGKVAKAAKGASAAAKAGRAAKSGSTIADRVGPEVAAAVRKAAAGPAPRTPRKPKVTPPERGNYATQAKYDAAYKRWVTSVGKYNATVKEADRIPIVSRENLPKGPKVDPKDSRGKTAKQVDADVAKQQAALTDAEKATIDAGKRAPRTRPSRETKIREKGVKGSSTSAPGPAGRYKAQTGRNPRKGDFLVRWTDDEGKSGVEYFGTQDEAVAYADALSTSQGIKVAKAQKVVKFRSKNSGTVPKMETSTKPPVKAVSEMSDDIKRFTAGRGNRSEAEAEQAANDLNQRILDVRKARNDGTLPDSEVKSGIANHRRTLAEAAKRAEGVKPTPNQNMRSRYMKDRAEQGSGRPFSEIINDAETERGVLNLSDRVATRTQVRKWKAKYDPNGRNPLHPKTDLTPYPGPIKEQIVQARNVAADRAGRADRAISRLQRNDIQRRPMTNGRNDQGMSPRESTRADQPDEVQLLREDRPLASVRQKRPRPGVGKGTRDSYPDKPGPNASNPEASSRRTAMPKKPSLVKGGKAARVRAAEAKAERRRGKQGEITRDPSTLPVAKGRSVTADPIHPELDGYPGLGDVTGLARGARQARPAPTEVIDSTGVRVPGTGRKPTFGIKGQVDVTKGPGSTRLRNVKKTAANSPKSSTEKGPTSSLSAKPAEKPTPAAETKPKKASTKPKSKPEESPSEAYNGPTKDAPQAVKDRQRAAYEDAEARGVIGKGDAERIMKGKDPKEINGKPVKKPSAKPKDAEKPAADSKPSKPAEAKPKKPKTEKPDNVTPITKAKGKGKKIPKKSRTAPVDPASTRRYFTDKMRGAAAVAVLGTAGAVAASRTLGNGKEAPAAAAGKPENRPNATPPAEGGKDTAKKKVFTDKSGDKYVLDQYGRRISLKEYKRRQAEKKARDAAKTPEAKLKLYKQQVARRKAYRESDRARKMYGKRATTVRYKPPVREGDKLRAQAKSL